MKKFIMAVILFLMTCTFSHGIHASSIDFEQLFESHQSVMLVIQVSTGDIHYANQAAVDFYGYDRTTLMSMNISEINTLSEEDIEKEIERAANESRNYFVFRHRLKDGSIRTVKVYAYPFVMDDEPYLYSIVIDHTVQAAVENRERFLMFTIIILLVAGISLASYFNVKMRKNEKMIASQKHHIERIIENTQIGTWSWYVPTGDVEYNEEWARMIGYTLSELKPLNISTWKKLTHPEDLNRSEEMIQEVFAKKREYYEIEIRMMHKNGHEVWVLDKGKVTSWTEEGKPLLVQGTHTNITQLKHIENKLRASHELMRYILEHDRSAIAIHDRDLKYVYVSKNYLKQYDVKDEDVIGKHHYDVFPDLPEKWREVHRRALQGEVLSNDRDAYEREDGHVLITRWECRPWYTESDEIGGIVVYTEVINDLISLEENLNRTQKMLLLVMDDLPIGIAVNRVLPKVEFIYMNDQFAKTYRTTKEDIENKGFFEAVYEDEDFRNDIRKRIESDVSTDERNAHWDNVPITRKGEPIRYVSAYNTKIEHSDLMISTVIDVTDQIQRQQEIENISYHDFLTGMYNRRYFEMMLDTMDEPIHYPLGLFMMDINGLKILNDAFGHLVGDEALRKFAKVIKESHRRGISARIGGDEFIILLPNTTVEEMEEIKESITDEISGMRIENIALTFSIGYALRESKDCDIQEIFKTAENEMYKKKVYEGKSVRNKAIQSILSTLTNKYKEEKKHSERVSRLCFLMGVAMEMSYENAKELELAGMVHDIGKVTIPDAILNKPGRLSDDEYTVIKTHTEAGYHILKAADDYSGLAEYALSHHERWDGHGYPRGLSKDSIPLYSRIISIVDSYEAMTSDRPYRKAVDPEIAIDELKRCKGTQFDPSLVDIFISLIQNHRDI